jgi:hypothetical protein
VGTILLFQLKKRSRDLIREWGPSLSNNSAFWWHGTVALCYGIKSSNESMRPIQDSFEGHYPSTTRHVSCIKWQLSNCQLHIKLFIWRVLKSFEEFHFSGLYTYSCLCPSFPDSLTIPISINFNRSLLIVETAVLIFDG